MGNFLYRTISVALLAGAGLNFATVFASSPAFNADERLENLDGGWRVSNLPAHYDKAEYMRELAFTFLDVPEPTYDPDTGEVVRVGMEELSTRTREAASLLDRSVRLDPANAAGWAYLAQAQGRFFEFDDMRASLAQSWDLAPNSVELAQLRLQLVNQIYRASLDPPAAEMGLKFGDGALAPGTYAIRLLMGNSFGGTSEPGARAFDVSIEGQLFLDDIDLVTRFGHNMGGLIEWVGEIDDGTIDIDFDRVIDDPLINGVEIRQLGATVGNAAGVVSNDGTVVADSSVGGEILYRWNAGTSDVPSSDEGPDWVQDASVIVGGPIIQVYSRRIAELHASALESMIPIDIYSQDHWPPSAGEVPVLTAEEIASAQRDGWSLYLHAPDALEAILPASDPVRALLGNLDADPGTG